MQSGNGWHRWSNCKLQGECWSSVQAGAKRLWGTVIQSENCFGALCLSFYNDLFHVCNWVVTGFPSVLLVYASGHCMCIVECCFKGKTIWQLLHRSYSIFCWCLNMIWTGIFFMAGGACIICLLEQTWGSQILCPGPGRCTCLLCTSPGCPCGSHSRFQNLIPTGSPFYDTELASCQSQGFGGCDRALSRDFEIWTYFLPLTGTGCGSVTCKSGRCWPCFGKWISCLWGIPGSCQETGRSFNAKELWEFSPCKTGNVQFQKTF